MYKNDLEKVINEEYNAIKEMEENLDYKMLNEIIELLYSCKGKIVFLGVGKSGHVCEKLAATFASTGTPSFFVHGTEACHGDLGMIMKDDIAILMSNSGSTKEVIQNIEPLKRNGVTVIGFTSKKDSPLAKNSDYQIIYKCEKEADELNLAPTVSSTLALVLGDALACALSKKRKFTRMDFFKYHPNGALGEALKKEIK